jgi:hypothetical protein
VRTLSPIERLYAETVDGHEKLASARVPEREGEHPAKAPDELPAELLVAVHKDLRVGTRLEGVAAASQVVPQLAVVVDLAVEDDDDRSIFARDRLPSAFGVDDAQSPDSESDRPFDEHALVIRSAMRDRAAHGP